MLIAGVSMNSLLSLLIAFVSIRDTYERDIPSSFAISFCVLLSFPFNPNLSSIINFSLSCSTSSIFLVLIRFRYIFFRFFR